MDFDAEIQGIKVTQHTAEKRRGQFPLVLDVVARKLNSGLPVWESELFADVFLDCGVNLGNHRTRVCAALGVMRFKGPDKRYYWRVPVERLVCPPG